MVLGALTPVVDGIAATLGSLCEVVLHDFRRPENSVVALAGTVTGRSVGGSMSEIGMGLLARGDEAADELNYTTRTRDGTLVKSSTMLLRDSTGSVFGALCVNLDITAVDQAHALLGELAGATGTTAVPTTTFGDDIGSVVDAIVDTHQLRSHKQCPNSPGPNAWSCSAASTSAGCSRSAAPPSRSHGGSASPGPPPTTTWPARVRRAPHRHRPPAPHPTPPTRMEHRHDRHPARHPGGRPRRRGTHQAPPTARPCCAHAPWTLVGAEVFVKCENFQRIGAFKFRGAYNAASRLSPEQLAKGIAAYSSGNHAQAVRSPPGSSAPARSSSCRRTPRAPSARRRRGTERRSSPTTATPATASPSVRRSPPNAASR